MPTPPSGTLTTGQWLAWLSWQDQCKKEPTSYFESHWLFLEKFLELGQLRAVLDSMQVRHIEPVSRGLFNELGPNGRGDRERRAAH